MKTSDRITIIAALGYSVIVLTAIVINNFAELYETPVKLSILLVVMGAGLYYLIRHLRKLK